MKIVSEALAARIVASRASMRGDRLLIKRNDNRTLYNTVTWGDFRWLLESRAVTLCRDPARHPDCSLPVEPAGSSYSVVGSNPGGGGARYQGTVTVEPTGETFRVTWDIGGQTFVGTGIGTNRGIAVSYRSGNQTGLAIYAPKGNDWEGVWTYTGGRTLGGEVWTRR